MCPAEDMYIYYIKTDPSKYVLQLSGLDMLRTMLRRDWGIVDVVNFCLLNLQRNNLKYIEITSDVPGRVQSFRQSEGFSFWTKCEQGKQVDHSAMGHLSGLHLKICRQLEVQFVVSALK
jgi:hypothetical protein